MGTRTTIRIDDTEYGLDDDFLSRVLETAVEGACSYWADVTTDSGDDDEDSDGARDFNVSDYTEDGEDADESGRHYNAASFLVSKDPTQGGTLDLFGIAEAIERIAEGEVDIPPAIREIILDAVRSGDADEIDAEAADVIVQVGLFDEIVYS